MYLVLGFGETFVYLCVRGKNISHELARIPTQGPPCGYGLGDYERAEEWIGSGVFPRWKEGSQVLYWMLEIEIRQDLVRSQGSRGTCANMKELPHASIES